MKSFRRIQEEIDSIYERAMICDLVKEAKFKIKKHSGATVEYSYPGYNDEA